MKTLLMRFLPKSLLGQMILLMAVALFIAQAVNFNLLLAGQQRLILAQSEGPAIGRFVDVATRVAAARTPEEREQALARPGRRFSFKFFSLDADNLVDRRGLPRNGRLETRLAAALADAGVPAGEVRATRGLDAVNPEIAERRRGARRELILLSARLGDGRWLNARVFAQRGDPFLIHRLGLSTLALYVLVLGAMLWITVRITRPLRDLTRAAESFGGRHQLPPVEPRGPSDLRHAINAFNAMNRRVVGLLDEKDRMLGAIGHDLRTPLASLRIRAETMDPETERSELVRTIEEMTETLEDILVLARTGRSREPARPMDVAALVDSVVEDFDALGKDVIFEPSDRLALDVQPNLLRRAIRNIIDNAVTYGARARVRVVPEGKGGAIEVDDDGPGIPDDEIATVLRPFERLEGSRSRETGGAGLGLAIAQAVAEAHGGELSLANRAEGGLRVRLELPSLSREG